MAVNKKEVNDTNRKAGSFVKGKAISTTIEEVGLLAHLLDKTTFELIKPINNWLVDNMTKINTSVPSGENEWAAVFALKGTVKMLKHDTLYKMDEDNKIIKIPFDKATLEDVLDVASFILNKGMIPRIQP